MKKNVSRVIPNPCDECVCSYCDGAGQTTAYAANTGVVYDAEKAEEPDTQFMSALATQCRHPE